MHGSFCDLTNYVYILLQIKTNWINVQVTRYLKGEDEDGVCKFQG